MPPLLQALQITLVGMTLVFAALTLLGLGMVLLVRWTAPRSPAPPVAPPTPTTARAPLSRRAAAAAVALALAQQAETVPHVFPVPPAYSVSAWQAVSRARQLQARGKTR